MIKGKYFHTLEWRKETDRKEFYWQGKVKDYDSENNLAYVQLFSWMDGTPSGDHLKKVTDDWVFYETADEMNEAWIATLPYKDQEHVRKMSKILRGVA